MRLCMRFCSWELRFRWGQETVSLISWIVRQLGRSSDEHAFYCTHATTVQKYRWLDGRSIDFVVIRMRVHVIRRVGNLQESEAGRWEIQSLQNLFLIWVNVYPLGLTWNCYSKFRRVCISKRFKICWHVFQQVFAFERKLSMIVRLRLWGLRFLEVTKLTISIVWSSSVVLRKL